MKVCYFLPWYSPAIIGGTEIYLVNLAAVVRAAGVEVTIICPSKETEPEQFEINGIPVITTPFIKLNPPGKQATGGMPPDQFAEFCLFLQELAPDVLHFHGFWQKHIFYLEAAHRLKIRTVITPHLATFTCLKGDLMFKDTTVCDGHVSIGKCSGCLIAQKTKGHRIAGMSLSLVANSLYRLKIHPGEGGRLAKTISLPFSVRNQLNIFRRIDEAVDALVALSPWYEEVLVQNGFNRDKVRLIRTSPEGHPSGDRKDDPAAGRLRMVFVGRQTREKGFHLLLDAISRFRPGEICLDLFGKVYEEDLENQVRSLKTAGFDIRQQGEIPHRDLLARLAQMDVLCLPSTCVEMAPLVVQEAFAAGVPVIGARLGGIADSIKDHTNGLLFKPNDANDLAEKISRLLLEPGLLGTLKQAAGSSFEVTDIRGSHIQLYQEILHKPWI